MFDFESEMRSRPAPTAVAQQARELHDGFSKTPLLRYCRHRDEAELLQHHQPVKHQIERGMLTVAKAEHVDIVQLDGAARRWNVPHGTGENAVLRPHERAFLNYDVVDDVNGMDFDTRIREGSEPTAEECGAGRFSLAVHTAWRLENDVVGKDFRKPVKVMGVEGGCPLFESLARGHCHSTLLRIVECGSKGRTRDDASLGGWYPGFCPVEEFRQLVAPLDAELSVCTGEVTLDGFERHVELVGDFSVGPALGRQLHDTQLSGT